MNSSEADVIHYAAGEPRILRTEPRPRAADAFTRTLVLLTAAYTLARVAGFYYGFGGTKRHHIEAASFIFLATVVAAIGTKRGQSDLSVSSSAIAVSSGWLAFFAGAFALYAPALTSGLFADDFVLLDAVREDRWSAWGGFWRPATLLVWRALDWLGGGNQAMWLHAANIALHGCNAYAVAVLSSRLQLPRPASWVAGGLFLTFPAAVEAVVWPSGMQDVLMTALVLGYLIALVTPTEHVRVATVTALAAFAAALCTKETAVAAPVLGVILVLASPQQMRHAWHVITASFVLILVYVVFRAAILALPTNHFEPPTRYLVKEMLARPFATLVVPFAQTELTLNPLFGISSVALVLVLVCSAAFRWSGRSPHFGRSIGMAAFVVGSVAPVYTYLYIQPDLHGSRYVYLASAGWAVLVSTLLHAFFPRRQHLRTAFAALLICLWAVAVRVHIETWRSAAVQREQMLVSATQILTESHCASVSAEQLPALAFGVPLWVNGFPEAMRMRLGSGSPAISVRQRNESCRLVWAADRFVLLSGKDER